MTLVSNFNPMQQRTQREITIEDFRGLGMLTLPKGTLVIIRDDLGTPEDGDVLVDAYVLPDAVFYGVRLEIADLEPSAATSSSRAPRS